MGVHARSRNGEIKVSSEFPFPVVQKRVFGSNALQPDPADFDQQLSTTTRARQVGSRRVESQIQSAHYIDVNIGSVAVEKFPSTSFSVTIGSELERPNIAINPSLCNRLSCYPARDRLYTRGIDYFIPNEALPGLVQ